MANLLFLTLLLLFHLACNCHGHASSCVYNQTVANSRLSLNSTGFYSGGGVCQNCTRNTTGINCETCIPLFFRAVGKSRSAIDVCTECNCSVLGSRLVPGVQFLDCVRDETVNISGLTAGDCYCKQNVHGKKCGVCRPEFYNLTQNNPFGCQGNKLMFIYLCIMLSASAIA
ncbi:laminin subunit alpha-2-like [Rhopilema esculentum]|uniref:laminin subunit alpha-2-like n=1 Tax=Rhopilema esculentum TaxID=499914 RepID=UPI0031E0DA3C